MLRIIVVDDHAVVRELLCHLLAQQNDVASVTPAADGFAAIRLLEDGLEADILVTDLQMPGMDGLELTRRAKAICPALPVILLTFFPLQLARPKALEAGAVECLSKEGDFHDLLSALRKAFNPPASGH